MREAIKMTVAYREKLEDILVEICEIFKGDIEKVKNKSRKTEHVKIRHLFFYVACRILRDKVPLRLIGDFVGGYDHASVIHGREVVQDYIDNKNHWFIDEWIEYEEKSVIWKSYLSAA